MSDRNLEYLVNYVGPVLFVKKQSIQYKDETRKLHTCTNQKCKEHGKDNRGFQNYCVKCGHKIEYISANTGERYEVYPLTLDDTFDNHYVPISKSHSNGLTMYNDAISLADDEAVYAPFFNEDEFNYGILAHVELGKYCKNKDCESFDECTRFEYDYCDECGKKNRTHIDKDVYSSIPEKKARKLLESYSSKSNESACVFIENAEFGELVEQFKQTSVCKKGIKAIEKAYGKGSVTVKLAYVQYHQNY